MPKETSRFLYKIVHWFTCHPWLKLIALGLTIMVWLYANAEINRFNLPVTRELWQGR